MEERMTRWVANTKSPTLETDDLDTLYLLVHAKAYGHLIQVDGQHYQVLSVGGVNNTITRATLSEPSVPHERCILTDTTRALAGAA
jgi:hypothetical protein